MRKFTSIVLFLLYIVLLDRIFFLPERLNGTWEYDEGFFQKNQNTFNTIEIINALEIRIRGRESESFYVLGCYFGRLYLLNEGTLDYTKMISNSY